MMFLVASLGINLEIFWEPLREIHLEVVLRINVSTGVDHLPDKTVRGLQILLLFHRCPVRLAHRPAQGVGVGIVRQKPVDRLWIATIGSTNDVSG